MNSESITRTFLDLFKSGKTILKVKFDVKSDEDALEVQVLNELKDKADGKAAASLEQSCSDPRLREFVEFYSKSNGFNFAIPQFPKNVSNSPLVRQLGAGDLNKFTAQYLPSGKWAWTIDLNKTKPLYRGEHKWLAFAEVDGGPACFTIFLEGENAGNVFLVTPQPHFNILKPIAKTYSDFLKQIAKDPIAFLKLIRAYVTVIEKDNQNYGYVPVEYVDDNYKSTTA
jgi:hypothetical protein